MKKLLLIYSIFAITSQSYSQTEKKTTILFDSTTQKYTYVRIFVLENKTSNDFYNLAKTWCKKKYYTDKFSLDQENEKLVQSVFFEITAPIYVAKQNSHTGPRVK